jgi:hypothetical protein
MAAYVRTYDAPCSAIQTFARRYIGLCRETVKYGFCELGFTHCSWAVRPICVDPSMAERLRLVSLFNHYGLERYRSAKEAAIDLDT